MYMKKLTCDICDHKVEGATFEEWMNNLKPHYVEAHTEVMEGKMGLSDEEKKAEMEAWMGENKKRFEETPEV